MEITMFPIYEEQRTKLAKDMNDSVQMIMTRAKMDVEFAVKCASEGNDYLIKVTENYIRLGYLHSEHDSWRKCGEFKNARSYVGKLARNMGRPLVVLSTDSPRQARYAEGGGGYQRHWYRLSHFSLPNLMSLAPLYAALELVNINPAHAWHEMKRPGTMHVTKQDNKARRAYTLVHYTEYEENCTPHPLVTHFIEQAATDPVTRQLLKITS
jgi:hypothetical protein